MREPTLGTEEPLDFSAPAADKGSLDAILPAGASTYLDARSREPREGPIVRHVRPPVSARRPGAPSPGAARVPLASSSLLLRRFTPR